MSTSFCKRQSEQRSTPYGRDGDHISHLWVFHGGGAVVQGARIRESGTTEGSEPDSTENPIPGAAVRGDGGTWRQGCSRPQRVALDRCPAWSQVGSTILAQAAGVPTYPWSGTGVQISYEECNGVIPEEIYERAVSSQRTPRTVVGR